MRARTFTLPFTRLGEFQDEPTTLPELDFDATDTLTVRPFASVDAVTFSAIAKEMDTLKGDDPEGEEKAKAIILRLLSLCVVEWTLHDGDGKAIPVPTTPAALLRLPAGLVGVLLRFFLNYRGEGTNPTTGS